MVSYKALNTVFGVYKKKRESLTVTRPTHSGSCIAQSVRTSNAEAHAWAVGHEDRTLHCPIRFRHGSQWQNYEEILNVQRKRSFF